MRDPLWRSALWDAGRDPLQAVAVAAATALLMVSMSTSALVVWTSGQAALERLDASSSVQQAAADRLDLIVSLPVDTPEDLAATVIQRVDAFDGFEEPEREIRSIGWLVRSGPDAIQPVVRANGSSVPAVLHHRSDAIPTLQVVAGPDPSGEVWLPEGLAAELGLSPGDELEVGFDPIGAAASTTSARTVLAGTYAVEGGRPVGALSSEEVRLPPAPGSLTNPAALVLGDGATIQRLGEELGELQVGSLQVAATRPPRYEDLLRGVEQLNAVQRDLFEPTSELGAMVFEVYNSPVVRFTSGARRLTTLAQNTADTVDDQVTGAAAAGVIVAVATLAAAVLAGARRRREQTVLELVQGSATATVAARGVLAATPAVLLGAGAGRLVVLPLAGLVLPVARVPEPAVAALTRLAVSAIGIALLVVLVVRVADAWLRLTSLGGRERARRIPVVPMLLAAAAVVVLGVAVGPARPPTDPLVLLLPVLVVAAVAVVTLRLVVRLVPTTGTPSDGPTAWWLARRGLAGQPERLVGVGTVVATAVGLVAHTGLLFASGSVGVDAKAAAVAGASVVVAVPDPGLLAGLGGTVVLEDDRVEVLPEETTVRLLAVDAPTFAAVAAWPARTDPSILDAVTASDSTSLPVLLVGDVDPLGDLGTLERAAWWSVPYEVVGRPAGLPGVDPDRPLLLTTQDALFSRIGEEQDPRVGPLNPGTGDPDGPWNTQVWFDESVDRSAVLAATSTLGSDSGIRVVRTLDQIRTQPAYLATTWGLGVLGGLGVVVLALALLLLGATRARDADEAGLELAVLERLGVSRGQQGRATLLERVALVVVASGIGLITGIAVTAIGLGAADPAPEIVPALALVVPVPALIGLVLALVLSATAAGLLDHRAARRADVEEALRVAR